MSFIFMLCVMALVKSVISQETNSTGVPSPTEKCQLLLGNCHCDDDFWYKRKVVIACRNMTDFSNFSQILRPGYIFEADSEYDVRFSGDTNASKYLPEKAFQGMYLYRLILDEPGLSMDEKVFEGVTHFERLHVRRSSIRDIPDFSGIKDSVVIINIDSSRLVKLKGKNLQNLTLLEELSFVNNFIRFIDADVFKGTNNVETLDLSHNLLTTLPAGLLDPMKKLLKFTASYNNLLHVNNLFSVTHPKEIYLDFNNINDTDSILHLNMERIETLHLTGNPIKRVSENSFNGKIPHVTSLLLDHCEIKVFDVEHYWSLPALKMLNLSHNLIEKGSKRHGANMTFTVERLDLSANRLRSLDGLLGNSQILYVMLARNQIQYLTDEDFKSVQPIAAVDLQENEIQRIDSRTFFPMYSKLYYLDLSSNLIASLNGSVRDLYYLDTLDLSHNLLQSFAKYEFSDLIRLRELSLQHNQIKVLGQLQRMRQLRYLNFSHNDIKLIKPEQLPKQIFSMQLAGNPVTCDCQIVPFVSMFHSEKIFDKDTGLCLQPEYENDLRTNANCPDGCSCGCTHNGMGPFMFVDCSSNNLSALPQFLENGFTQTRGNLTTRLDDRRSLVMYQNVEPPVSYQNEYFSLHIKDRVLGINLENNSLESLDEAELPADLVELYLSNNKLRSLPDFIFDNLLNLTHVSLSRNPWDCDCNAIKFKRWLASKHDTIIDIKEVRCGTSKRRESNLNKKVIYTLTDLDLCPTDGRLIASASFAVLMFLATCLSAKFLLQKHERHIKAFLYFLGFDSVKKDSDDYQKFDAFLSFSHRDSEFVTREIISVIEKKDPNIRLCIHYRHFSPGELIYDNIVNAVQNSKRTVLIVSRNFLESEWCIMEFRAAHLRSLEDKLHRIIVIKVGELPTDIDPPIKAYLDNTTYLIWEENYFWMNLLYVLPTSTTVRNPIPRCI